MRRYRLGGVGAEQSVLYLIMVLVLVILMAPIMWLVFMSLTPRNQLYNIPMNIIPPAITVEAYKVVAGMASGYMRNYLNSVILTVSVLTMQLFFGSMAGYSFARIDFPGRDKLFWGFLIWGFVPGGGELYVLYNLTEKMHLMNTLPAVILPLGLGGIFGTAFILRGVYMGFSKEIEEAAVIDGCGTFGLFTRIFLPMSRNGLVAASMLSLPGIWGEYLLSITLITEPKWQPIAVALKMIDPNNSNWDLARISAAHLFAILPVVIMFFFFQKAFLRGITEGGFKF